MKPKPLAAPPAPRRGPAPVHDWPAITEQLRRSPGVWHEVAVYPADRRRSGTNETRRIKQGINPAFREGRWDATTRRLDSGELALYVCFEPSDD